VTTTIHFRLTIPVETIQTVMAAVRHLEEEANRPVAARPPLPTMEEVRRRNPQREMRTRATATILGDTTQTTQARARGREGTAR
jgi:hypothetical protein